MPVRVWVALLAVVAAVGLSACYGSTEPATDVTGDTATLHAQGTANHGKAVANFQLWPTKTGVHQDTGTRVWPAGASGPFTEQVHALEANTEYSFRLCGRDQDQLGADVCAQTRTFTTGPLRNDWVQGNWSVGNGGSFSGGVYARGGASGENPTGTVGITEQCDINHCFAFDGSVTCMKVQGNRAVVGAVGTENDAGDPSPPTAATRLVFVLDDDSAGDKTSYVSSGGATPPDCAAAGFDTPGTAAQATVRDAPSP